MQSQIQQKPIFVPIINQRWTPNHISINIVCKWFEELYGKAMVYPVYTEGLTPETFAAALHRATQSTIVCLYICVHGKQFINKESGQLEEYVLLNENHMIPDAEFTKILNGIPYRTLLIFNESCHGGGFVENIKLDDHRVKMDSTNVVIVNACSKEQKCYVRRDPASTTGLLSGILYESRVNPFYAPEKALQVAKRVLPQLKTKITVVKNLS